jgi:hypothetical protein
VLKVTEVSSRLGEHLSWLRTAPKEGAAKSGIGVMFTQLNRLFPLAGLAVALSATLAWMGFFGYYVSKLF